MSLSNLASSSSSSETPMRSSMRPPWRVTLAEVGRPDNLLGIVDVVVGVLGRAVAVAMTVREPRLDEQPLVANDVGGGPVQAHPGAAGREEDRTRAELLGDREVVRGGDDRHVREPAEEVDEPGRGGGIEVR